MKRFKYLFFGLLYLCVAIGLILLIYSLSGGM